MKLTVEFNTRDYERAHNKMPRGYGSWAFSIESRNPQPEEIMWVHGATLGEAKRQIRERVRAIAPPDLDIVEMNILS